MDEKNQNQENLEAIENQAPEKAAPEAPAEPIAEPAAETAPEQAPPPAQKPEPQKKPSVFRGNKFKRGGMATIMTVVFIAVVVVVNLLVSILSDRFPSLNIDLTAQKMNTLSDQAMEIVKTVEEKTHIYLIGSEDAYRNDAIYANYGLKYSQVANLAERLQEANQNIQVEFIDPDSNPEFISQYANDYLSTGRVLVRTEKRYRVLGLTDMFSQSQNQTTGETEMYSNVDSALAAAIEMVNMDKVPVLTIATGHNEMLNSDNMEAFLDMMKKQNFDVQEIDILTQDIPEDTQILMIPTPTTDYTVEEVDKLRALLEDKDREESVTVLAAFYPTQSELPNISSFLEEWGVSVKSGSVVMESDSDRYALADPRCVIVDSASEVFDSNTYTRLVSPLSVPLEVLFTGNGDIGVETLWTTSDKAYVLTENDSQEAMENPDTAQQVVAAMSSSIVQFGNTMYRRSVVVFGSSTIFTDGFMETAFSNGQYVSDLMKIATDTDGSKVSVYTERVKTNSVDVTASQNTIVMLGLGVFTIGLPVVILILGLAIFLKRRHL